MGPKLVDPKLTHFRSGDGLRLTADVWGDDDAWPVLFMHGGGQTRHAWGATARRVAQHGWRAISLDLRGHGDSDWSPTGDYEFTAYGNDCLAVTEQLGRRPVLVGASLGGISALVAESRVDHDVATAIVLVDIAPLPNRDGVERIRSFMVKGIEGFASLEEVADAIAAYTPQRKRAVNLQGLQKVVRLRDDGRWHWHWDPALMDRRRTEVPQGSESLRLLTGALDKVRVPTLLVRGGISDVVTDQSVDYLCEHVPQTRVVVVEGAGHMVAGDQNDAFSSAVIDFLDTEVRPSLP